MQRRSFFHFLILSFQLLLYNVFYFISHRISFDFRSILFYSTTDFILPLLLFYATTMCCICILFHNISYHTNIFLHISFYQVFDLILLRSTNFTAHHTVYFVVYFTSIFGLFYYIFCFISLHILFYFTTYFVLFYYIFCFISLHI
jgi:hypothetical protein